MTDAAGQLDLRVLLDAVDGAAPLAAAEVLGRASSEAVDADDASFLIADFSGKSLQRLSHVERRGNGGALARERSEVVAIEDTPHGQALADQAIGIRREDDVWQVIAPVSSRGEAVGVLELWLSDEPQPSTLAIIDGAAHALAYIIIANRRYTDLYEWGQRSIPLSLEAEIQHRLLPGAYTCDAGSFTLAGWLEPAGDVGGDTFDFSLARDTLHLSMTDAMGHTLSAALLATVLVGALRNARTPRRGARRAGQLEGYANEEAFVTGQLMRVDLHTGIAHIINAASAAAPDARRRGGRHGAPCRPTVRHAKPAEYRVQEMSLEPGDRLVLMTDGMLERNASVVDVVSAIAATRELHPREAVQVLTRAVVEACGGRLDDDATVLCLDWHGSSS